MIFWKVWLPTTLILSLATAISLTIWKWWFVQDPFKHHRISRWRGLFQRKSPFELGLDRAARFLKEGSYRNAEEAYRACLQKDPERLEVRLGLAESLFEESLKGVLKDRLKRAEALEHFRWVLRHYKKTGREELGKKLGARLVGPYSREELGGDLPKE